MFYHQSHSTSLNCFKYRFELMGRKNQLGLLWAVMLYGLQRRPHPVSYELSIVHYLLNMHLVILYT